MSKGSRILLLEDDRHIGLALQIRLNASGYRVTLAETVSAAHKHIESFVPDVAVLDYNLPDGNGIDFIQSLRALDSGMHINIVIMTASRKPGLRDLAIASGANSVLEKPFDSSALLGALEPVESKKLAS